MTVHYPLQNPASHMRMKALSPMFRRQLNLVEYIGNHAVIVHGNEFDGFPEDRLKLNGRRPTAELHWASLPRKLAMLSKRLHPGIAFNKHFEGDGAIIFKHACMLGCEGIVSKRLGSPYRTGRFKQWLKVKNPVAPAAKREVEKIGAARVNDHDDVRQLSGTVGVAFCARRPSPPARKRTGEAASGAAGR